MQKNILFIIVIVSASVFILTACQSGDLFLSDQEKITASNQVIDKALASIVNEDMQKLEIYTTADFVYIEEEQEYSFNDMKTMFEYYINPHGEYIKIEFIDRISEVEKEDRIAVSGIVNFAYIEGYGAPQKFSFPVEFKVDNIAGKWKLSVYENNVDYSDYN